MKENYYNRVEEAFKSVRALTSHTPKVGIVLGSGLNNIIDSFNLDTKIPYGKIAGFLEAKVAGHRGEMAIGKDVAVLAGRFHYYEHQDMDTSILPIFLLKRLGVQTVILTNAAGGINRSYKVADVVLISDHINHLPNPLIGLNDERFGTRFPDMSQVYKRHLIKKALAIDPTLGQGVYLAVTGPSFETPAEIRAFEKIGADLVGMSTVPEAICANYLGMDVLGVSTVTDMCIKEFQEGLAISHEEVLEAGKQAQGKVAKLLLKMTAELTK